MLFQKTSNLSNMTTIDVILPLTFTTVTLSKVTHQKYIAVVT